MDTDHNDPPAAEPLEPEPVDEQPVDEQPVDEQPVDEQPVDEQPVDEQPVDEQPVDEQPVPRLPKSWGWRLARADLFRIGMLGGLLVAVIAMREPCSDGVAGFMSSFDPAPDAGAVKSTERQGFEAPTVPDKYIRITGPVTEEELKKKIEALENGENKPGATKPDATKPDATKPDATKPDATKPGP